MFVFFCNIVLSRYYKMRLETFKTLISKIQQNSDDVSYLYPKIDVTNFTDGFDQVITILLKCYYGDEGEDWISWFLYERDPERGLLAYDKNGNEICSSVEELWKTCEECRLTKEDYVIPTPLTDEEREEMIKKMFDK